MMILSIGKVPKLFLILTLVISILSFNLMSHETSAILRQEPLATSMVHFSDVRTKKKLSGAIFAKETGFSVTQCALKCNRIFKCLSFNVRGRSVCELNEADVFSVGVKNQHLLEDSIGVAYFGMARDSIPACRERGFQQNIRDDSVGICLINGKRVDREWSEWEQKSNITGEGDYFEFLWREILVDYAHGGIKGEDQFRIVERQLRIVREAKNWNDAASFCEMIDGKLFSDLDGTVEQVKTLVDLLGNSFWLGLTLSGGEYHRVGGGILPDSNIVWMGGKPDQSPGEVHLMVNAGLLQIDDMWTYVIYGFFCDMLY